MNDHQLWNDIDDCLNPLHAPDDDVLAAVLRDSEDAGLPQIAVAPNQGTLLQLLLTVAGLRAG